MNFLLLPSTIDPVSLFQLLFFVVKLSKQKITYIFAYHAILESWLKLNIHITTHLKY